MDWVMRMRWVDLLFAHWPFEPAVIQPLIPAGLELDTFDGRAWLGIVPFRMEGVAPRGLPVRPLVGPFPELNVFADRLDVQAGWPSPLG